MATLFTISIDPAQLRNAREAIQTRVQGATTLLDDPVVIREVSATVLEVQLPDALPAEELRSIISGFANLVNRPGSGIISAAQISPEHTAGTQRTYSV